MSKGVGYVSFAIREDATLAMDKISNEGIVMDGRSLRVQWAESKVTEVVLSLVSMTETRDRAKRKINPRKQK